MSWGFALFFIGYNSVNLTFSMKYWSLSLRIQSVIKKQITANSRQDLMVRVTFWSLQSLNFIAFALTMCAAYLVRAKESYQFTSYQPIELTTYSINLSVSLATLCLLFDSLLRLRRCVKNEPLAISNAQLFLHVSSFTLSTITVILGVTAWSVYLLFNNKLVPKSTQDYDRQIKYVVETLEICAITSVVSSLPIFIIINSLINRGIADRLDEESLANDYRQSSFTQSVQSK